MSKKERNIRRVCFFGGVAILALLLCGTCSRSEETKATDVYMVKQGDTLWSIAGKCKRDNSDSREFIQLMYELNEGLDTKILPGQMIIVPVMEE